MKLGELLQAGDVEETQGNIERAVAGLAYDSRQVKPGFVFFAVPGTKTDGHEYIADALARGAAALVVERPIARPGDAATIRVRNVRRTMGNWAARFYDYPSRRAKVAGVTGTNGKTTVTYILESIFRAAGMAPGVV
ncbi:MAG TPA: Mur ligase domain-containing protein, partial [Candidatus Binatia bacterium]|nr:Mur ligase domain-containing protein [Candidatus Binatia bacterium]